MPRRFDLALMRPPAPQPLADPALLARLRAWCEAGAHAAEAFGAASIAPHAGLDGVACALDGSHELARLGRWRGLAWRLQLLVQEQMPGHRLGPEAPWDCGWWRAGPLQAAAAFRPRRVTLLLANEPEPAIAAALLATLRAASPAYARPLRLLVVSALPLAGQPRL
ncbi:conserved hypothetical protein [Rubrivivax sp. A210]|uniref:hypothetical protein n=1 Tax=Rubrivivax sp. A210 TaxID=2772301 RepID=UPI001919E8E6|nr:hypothetical protein [Rubrivivax sp. A210]CAD5371989.1 conserved hypothetical protein [Rubrivivax sp. A210]